MFELFILFYFVCFFYSSGLPPWPNPNHRPPTRPSTVACSRVSNRCKQSGQEFRFPNGFSRPSCTLVPKSWLYFFFIMSYINSRSRVDVRKKRKFDYRTLKGCRLSLCATPRCSADAVDCGSVWKSVQLSRKNVSRHNKPHLLHLLLTNSFKLMPCYGSC